MTPAQAKSIIRDAKKFFVRFGNELSQTQADIWKKALLPSTPMDFSKAKEALQTFFISNPAYINKYKDTMPPVADFMEVYRGTVAPPLKKQDCPCCNNTRWISINRMGDWTAYKCRECQQGISRYGEGVQCMGAQCQNPGKKDVIRISKGMLRFDPRIIEKLKNCEYVESVIPGGDDMEGRKCH